MVRFGFMPSIVGDMVCIIGVLPIIFGARPRTSVILPNIVDAILSIVCAMPIFLELGHVVTVFVICYSYISYYWCFAKYCWSHAKYHY